MGRTGKNGTYSLRLITLIAQWLLLVPRLASTGRSEAVNAGLAAYQVPRGLLNTREMLADLIASIAQHRFAPSDDQFPPDKCSPDCSERKVEQDGLLHGCVSLIEGD